MKMINRTYSSLLPTVLLLLIQCSYFEKERQSPFILGLLAGLATISPPSGESENASTDLFLTLYVRQTDGLNTNPGTSEMPLLTIAKAVEIIQNKNAIGEIKIAAGTYNEYFSIDRKISLYGGYEQTNWNSRNNKDRSNVVYRTRIQGSNSPTIAVSPNIQQSITIDGLNILGHSSASSIAVSIQSSITLSNNTIDGNTASSTAVRISNESKPVLLNNDIWSTVPHSYGIYIVNASPNILNNVIRGGSSAVIYISGTSAVKILNNHITNGVKGIDLSGNEVNVSLKNNIIVNNSSYGIYNIDSILNSTYNDVWNNSTNYFNSAAGTGSMSLNPIFVNATDFRLQSTSALICSGTDLTSDFSNLNLDIKDKDDIARITTGNNFWNIGAYETTSSTGLTGCL